MTYINYRRCQSAFKYIRYRKKLKDTFYSLNEERLTKFILWKRKKKSLSDLSKRAGHKCIDRSWHLRMALDRKKAIVAGPGGLRVQRGGPTGLSRLGQNPLPLPKWKVTVCYHWNKFNICFLRIYLQWRKPPPE